MTESYVTLATNDSYALGALVLAHSLQSAQTSKQLCILITPDVSLEVRCKLEDVYNSVVTVDILDSNDTSHLSLLKRPELGITLTKLHCWSLIQYTKCVFLDADILAIQNADELFKEPELSAACDIGWPDCFNSGMFVFSPSMETYGKLLDHAVNVGSFDGGDQGLLNSYFTNWNRLSFIYNMVSSASYTYLPAYKQYGRDVKFVHFLGAVKPWHQIYHKESESVDPRSGQEHITDHLNTWWRICSTYVQPEVSQEVCHWCSSDSFEPYPESNYYMSNFMTNADPDVSIQVYESNIYHLPSTPSPKLLLDDSFFPLSTPSISFPNEISKPHQETVVSPCVYDDVSPSIVDESPSIADESPSIAEESQNREEIIESFDINVSSVEVCDKVCLESESDSSVVLPENVVVKPEISAVIPENSVVAPDCHVITADSRDEVAETPAVVPDAFQTPQNSSKPDFGKRLNDSYDRFIGCNQDNLKSTTKHPLVVPDGLFHPLMSNRISSPFSITRPIAVSQIDETNELSERLIELDLSVQEEQESKQRWESGLPDYLGKDSFENIQAHIDGKLQSSN